MSLPLEGIYILELAPQFPGPYCTMLLADLGAEVLKVERPGIGDPARQFPHIFKSVNRNKKSMTLNLKVQSARGILSRLIKKYDVFVEGFRPGVASGLGIDYENLRKINSRVIYCSISGYGQEGPYRDLPGHDLNYQAASGMLQQGFRDKKGNFIIPEIPMSDLCSGMFSAIGIMATLMAREKNGEGQYIDVSMFDGLLSWMSIDFAVFFETGQFVRDRDAGYGIFLDKDGKPFVIGIAHEDSFWDPLCSAIGLEECIGLRAAERRSRREELREKLQTIFSQKPLHLWYELLMKADVPISPVQSLDKVAKDPHVAYRKMVREISLRSGEKIKQINFPIRFSHFQPEFRIPFPELGEHTTEILESIGYSKNEREDFMKRGVV